MRRLNTVVLAVVAVALLTTAASAYTVASGHPRLYFQAADVAELRARCNGALSGDYNDMKNWCDSHINDSLPLSVYYMEGCLPAYSFLWVIEQDSRYADRAKAIASAAISAGQEDGIEFMCAGSLFFDWCYSYLSSSEREYFGSALVDGGEARIASENWQMMNNYHSKISRLREFAYLGLALYGAGVDDAAAREFCDMFEEHTYGSDYTLCVLNEIAGDGAYFQGEYTMSGLVTKFREGCEVWATATDENPFEDSTNLQNMAEYLIYEIGCRESSSGSASLIGSKQGDSHSHGTSGATARVALYNLASRYNDRAAQWMADEIDAQGMGYINNFHRWKLCIAKDPSISPLAPTGFPGARLFEKIGTLYIRSGWDMSYQSDDTYAVFRCEAYPAGHTHAHQNHFVIARGNDLLAVDSGAYDSTVSSHHLNYFERTIAHNCVTVYDAGESTFGSRSNDGGQKPPSTYDHGTFCGDASTPAYDRGGITGFDDSDAYVYVRGDATNAYASYKVDGVIREIVHLKPDAFVILDRVSATSSSYQKKWLLHTINQPSVSANETVVVQGDSKMFVKTMLPLSVSIDRVGGSGNQFNVNGTNYAPSGDIPDDAGAWRIEVSPTSPQAETLFLHVVYICDSGVQSMPETRLIDTDDVVGVQVGDDVVLFSGSGASIESLDYMYE